MPSSALATIVDSVQCPKCNGESKVIDSRDEESARRRRRRCERCKYRYTTYEIHADEYNRIRRLKVDAAQIEPVITTLRSIAAQFGGANGKE